MATAGSLAELTTDEVEGSRPIGKGKHIEEESTHQSEQTEAIEMGKDKVETKGSFEPSVVDAGEIVEIKDISMTDESTPVIEVVKEKVYPTSTPEILVDNKGAHEEVKREVEEVVASAFVVLEDKKEDTHEANEDDKKENAPEVPKENDSQVSDSEVLVASAVFVDKKDGEPAVDKIADATDSQVSESEIMYVNKEASAIEDVNKDESSDVASASIALEDKKEDSSKVDGVEKEGGSQAFGFEILSDNQESSNTVMIKKEGEDDVVPTSDILVDSKEDVVPTSDLLVDSKEDAPTANQASGLEVLENNEDLASTVEDVKKDAETGKISGSSDGEIKATVESPQEISVGNVDSSSSVQESEHAGYGPEVSEPIIIVANGTEKPLIVSANEDLPATDAKELEKESGALEADEIMDIGKHTDVITAVQSVAIVDDEAVAETFKEEPISEMKSSALENSDTVSSDPPISGSIEKVEEDAVAGQCQEGVAVKESKQDTIEILEKVATVGSTLPSPAVATGETGAVVASSAKSAAEVVVHFEKNTEEQGGEKAPEVESVEEQREEKPTGGEDVIERGQEKIVEMDKIVAAAGQIEASSSERDQASEDADKISVVAEGTAEETENENVNNQEHSDVVTKIPEKSVHESAKTEEKTAPAEANGIVDLSEPSTKATEPTPEEEKPAEASDKIVEQRDCTYSSSTEKSEKIEEPSEVSEKSVEEPKQENGSVKGDDATLAQASSDMNSGPQPDDTGMSTGEQVVKLDGEKLSADDAVDKDETENVEESEATKDGVISKSFNPEVPKAEVSGKTSKTLMSKVKSSIVKVKKAIIGKSTPSSKTVSTE